MIAILKILHFLAFSAGIGGGIANALLGAQAAKAEPSARPLLGAVSQKIGMVSTTGLAILWITGLILAASYGFSGLGWAFWVKMLFVLGLTAASVELNRETFRARKSGTPPPQKKMKQLGMAALGSATGALVLAVIAFTG